jgi:hypothetical protein
LSQFRANIDEVQDRLDTTTRTTLKGMAQERFLSGQLCASLSDALGIYIVHQACLGESNTHADGIGKTQHVCPGEEGDEATIEDHSVLVLEVKVARPEKESSQRKESNQKPHKNVLSSKKKRLGARTQLVNEFRRVVAAWPVLHRGKPLKPLFLMLADQSCFYLYLGLPDRRYARDATRGCVEPSQWSVLHHGRTKNQEKQQGVHENLSHAVILPLIEGMAWSDEKLPRVLQALRQLMVNPTSWGTKPFKPVLPVLPVPLTPNSSYKVLNSQSNGLISCWDISGTWYAVKLYVASTARASPKEITSPSGASLLDCLQSAATVLQADDGLSKIAEDLGHDDKLAALQEALADQHQFYESWQVTDLPSGASIFMCKWVHARPVGGVGLAPHSAAAMLLLYKAGFLSNSIVHGDIRKENVADGKIFDVDLAGIEGCSFYPVGYNGQDAIPERHPDAKAGNLMLAAHDVWSLGYLLKDVWNQKEAGKILLQMENGVEASITKAVKSLYHQAALALQAPVCNADDPGPHESSGSPLTSPAKAKPARSRGTTPSLPSVQEDACDDDTENAPQDTD